MSLVPLPVLHGDSVYYGPEYISHALLTWVEQRHIRIQHIQPGQPCQNAYVERYHRTLRYGWLAQTLFDSIDHVQDAATQ